MNNGPRSGPVSAVIFDMDGVLIDTEPLFQIVSQRAAAELGHTLRDDLFAELSGLPGAKVEEALYLELGRDFDFAAFQIRARKYWFEQLETNGIAQKPGVEELLDTLAGRNCPYAVATSTHAARARSSLEVAGLAGRIDLLVGGDEVDNGKPAPDIFIETAARLRAAPRECIVVEDSAAGIAGAAAAGMCPIMVPDLKQPTSATRALAYRTVASLHEAAELIVDLLDNGRPDVDPA